MDELEFKITIDEANLILEGLGHLPFAKVFQLVAKLQNQASAQLGATELAQPGDDDAAMQAPVIAEERVITEDRNGD